MKIQTVLKVFFTKKRWKSQRFSADFRTKTRSKGMGREFTGTLPLIAFYLCFEFADNLRWWRIEWNEISSSCVKIFSPAPGCPETYVSSGTPRVSNNLFCFNLRIQSIVYRSNEDLAVLSKDSTRFPPQTCIIWHALIINGAPWFFPPPPLFRKCCETRGG